jgi:hypothetical protein
MLKKIHSVIISHFDPKKVGYHGDIAQAVKQNKILGLTKKKKKKKKKKKEAQRIISPKNKIKIILYFSFTTLIFK